MILDGGTNRTKTVLSTFFLLLLFLLLLFVLECVLLLTPLTAVVDSGCDLLFVLVCTDGLFISMLLTFSAAIVPNEQMFVYTSIRFVLLEEEKCNEGQTIGTGMI